MNLTDNDIRNIIGIMNRAQFNGLQEAQTVTQLSQKLTAMLTPPTPEEDLNGDSTPDAEPSAG